MSIALDLKLCLRTVVLAFVTLVNISLAALNDRNSSRKRNFSAGYNPLHDVTIIFNLIHMDGGDITYNKCNLNNSWLDRHFKETQKLVLHYRSAITKSLAILLA